MLVMGRTCLSFFEHQTNAKIIFQTSNELKLVQLLLIQLEHSIFGFEQTNNELTQTLKELECVNLFVIELKHPIFGLKRSNFKHSSTHHY